MASSLVDELTTAASHAAGARYFTYAIFALLIYDHILTMPEEVAIVWNASFTVVKGLFFFNRYVVPLFLAVDIATLSGLASLTDKFCHDWIMADGLVEVVSLYATTLMIAYRVYAVWGKSRVVFYILGGFWAIHVGGSTTALILTVFTKNAPSLRHEPVFNVCFGDSTDTWWIWLPGLIFHTVVFILLLLKAILTPRDAKTPMLRVLIRDGMLYFGVVSLAFMFNLLVWALGDSTIAALPHFTVWSFCTIATSRLLLSLHVPEGSQDRDDEGWDDDNVDSDGYYHAGRPSITSLGDMTARSLTPDDKLQHITSHPKHWKTWSPAAAAIVDFSDFSQKPYHYQLKRNHAPQLPPMDLEAHGSLPRFHRFNSSQPSLANSASEGGGGRRQSSRPGSRRVSTEGGGSSHHHHSHHQKENRPKGGGGGSRFDDAPPVPRLQRGNRFDLESRGREDFDSPMNDIRTATSPPAGTGTVVTSKFGALEYTSYRI